MMKTGSLLLVAFALATGACSGATADSTQPQTQAAAATKAPVAPTSHGAVKIVGEALGEVSLRADQRSQLEKLAADAETRHAAMAASRKDLLSALAGQVEAGSIDKSALQPKIDKVTADAQKAHADDQAAMVKVHALLDADQRNAFVDALHDKMKARVKEHGFGHMKQLAEDLKLTDDQKDQIKQILKAEHGHHMNDAFHDKRAGKHGLESFRGDKFDGTELAQPDMSKGADKMIGVVEKIVPILTPEQRKIAADKIRSMQEGPF